MELGEKLLYNQHNVTYPPVNPTVQEPPRATTAYPINENLLEEPKAKVHGVETQAESGNIFEDKVRL